jgi:hypothetical protein
MPDASTVLCIYENADNSDALQPLPPNLLTQKYTKYTPAINNQYKYKYNTTQKTIICLPIANYEHQT